MNILKNIPVGIKLVGGFALVLALLILISIMGVNGLQNNSKSTASYQELASLSNLSAKMQATVLGMETNAKEYMATSSQQALKLYKDELEASRGHLSLLLSTRVQAERRDALETVESDLSQYDSQMAELAESRTAVGALVAGMRTNGWNMVKGLDDLENMAKQDGNYQLANEFAQSKAMLLSARLKNAVFVYKTKSKQDMDAALAAFADFSNQFRNIDVQSLSDEGKKIHENVGWEYSSYMDGTMQFMNMLMEQGELIGRMNTISGLLVTHIQKATSTIMEDQEHLGTTLRANNDSAITNMQTLSIIAILSGLVLSTLLSFNISVPLRKAAVLMKGLARGELDQTISVSQKDEIGDICNGISSVVTAISDMKQEFDLMVDKVSSGALKVRCQEGRFEGGFKDIMHSTNTLANVIVGFVDSAPMPMITMDRDMNILFMNKAGLQVVEKDEQDVVGAKCSDMMCADDCNTPNCACLRAMELGTLSEGTTRARPGRSELEIDYRGIPIERDGEVIGAWELVIDQTTVRQAQQQILSVVERATNISAQLSSASEHLASHVEQVSQGAVVQRERVSETATAMEQMNATVMEVAQNASHASTSTTQARNKAAEGSTIVADAVHSITEVSSVTGELRANMEKLDSQVNDIGMIMNVISDIADQTNLLALNAAIEAARAGDAGRGFAVVADEVRKLAEKTMNATREVGDSINAIQSAAKLNMQSMDKASQAVHKATELANASGSSLSTIVNLVENSAQQVTGIATASEQQSAASEQINRALDEVNGVVHETTRGMEQSAQSIQELAVMSGELKQMIAELQKQ